MLDFHLMHKLLCIASNANGRCGAYSAVVQFEILLDDSHAFLFCFSRPLNLRAFRRSFLWPKRDSIKDSAKRDLKWRLQIRQCPSSRWFTSVEVGELIRIWNRCLLAHLSNRWSFRMSFGVQIVRRYLCVFESALKHFVQSLSPNQPFVFVLFQTYFLFWIWWLILTIQSAILIEDFNNSVILSEFQV